MMKWMLSAIETVAALALLVIALLTAGNVVVRGAMSTQIPDWFDGSKLLMAIALFWGIAIATYYAAHICVDVVWEQLGKRGRRWMDATASLITFAFLAPMAYMVMAKVLSSGTQATTDLRLPLIWFTSVAAVGAIAAAVLALVRFVMVLRGHDTAAEAQALDGLATAGDPSVSSKATHGS